MEEGILSSETKAKRPLDASFGKKYITKNNYFYAPLHKPAENADQRLEIQRKNEQLREKYKRKIGSNSYSGPLAKYSRGEHKSGNCNTPIAFNLMPAIRANDAEDDLTRLPESSDEDDGVSSNQLNKQEIQSSAKAGSTTEPNKKRKAVASERPQRSQRGRTKFLLDDAPAVGNVEIKEGKTPSQHDFLHVLGSSQGKRARGAVKTFTSSQRSKESFSCPEPVSQTTPRKQLRQKDMFIADEIESQSLFNTPRNFKTTSVTPKSNRVRESDIGFQLPEIVDAETDSRRPYHGSNLHLDESFNSPEQLVRLRRDSSSSLSSTDSIAEHQLSKQDKEAIMNGQDKAAEVDSRYQVRCPMCKRVTNRVGLGIYENPSDFTLQRQQKFCYKHRIRDAKEEWQRAAYPEIDWNGSLLDRIAEQTNMLSKVLRRETPSYYLNTLESKVKEAKGNQSQIKHYFDSEVMDVVDQGYYGPRGSKVMASYLANDELLRKLFDRQSRSDRIIRTAGFGRFIESVLVPEMVLRLVMEDMSTDDENEARKILRDSTEVGILLHPGDDYIARITDE